ncbi:MAG TPA: tetratricopeptide repeat-containing sensor histidine kinase [Chryseosolibacter sp.]
MEFRFLAAYLGMVLCCFQGNAQSIRNDSFVQSLTESAYSLFLNKPDSAIQLAKQAYEISIQNGDAYHEGYAALVLSKAYWVKANYRLSTEYGFKALKVFEKSEHRREHGNSLLAVARTLMELGNFGKADELLTAAYNLATQVNDQRLLAETFRERSFYLTELNQLDSALMYSDKGLLLFEALGDSLDASVLYSRKSRILFAQKDYVASRKFAFRGMLLDTLVGNRRGLAISYFQAAQNEHALGNFQSAERLLQNSIRINKEIGNLTSLVRAHELLATVLSETNRHKMAVTHLQLASQFKDSLYNSEKSGQTQEMQSLYELEGKENQIKLLEQEKAIQDQDVKNQKLVLIVLVVGMLFLVALLFFLTRLRKIQNKTNQDLAAKNIAIEQQKEELQAQAEKMQQLNQLQTKLFSVISHDLRGPISNVQSLLDLLTKKMLTPDEFVLISDKLKSNLNVTQRTLENLLSWALSQMDGIKTEKKTLDLNSCIEEACRLMEEVANRKAISIKKELASNFQVQADPDQLQLILRNLIHNGIKFSKVGDEVKVETNRSNGHCVVSVKDTGIGMTKEEIEMVTGAREHFTKRGTQQEKGTGLGLLLCKEFIERNEGKMTISSATGIGTEITFTLKLAGERLKA